MSSAARTMPQGVPFVKGSGRARKAGRKGGLAGKDKHKLTHAVVQILDALAPLGVLGLMDRFGLTGPSWAAWRVVAKVLDGTGLTSTEQAIYEEVTHRTSVPKTIRTLWAIIGRRGGKSHFAAIVSVHAATRRYPMLAVGERARVLLLAKDRTQAGVLYDYIDGMFREDAELAQLVVGRTQTTIRLANRVLIQVATSSFRTVRGFTLAAVVADETAWWMNDEAANPDKEILRALRPGLATIPGARLICITTPFARQGAAFDAFQRHYGDEAAPVLVLNAPSRAMNPLVDEAEIEADELEDPESAAAEWHGSFRADKEGYARLEVLDARTGRGIVERAPMVGVAYLATVDAAGGSGQDSFTLSVQHVDGGRAAGGSIQDLLREWKPPFSPEDVVAEIAALVAPYRITKVIGDKFGGGLVPSAFRRHGLAYETAARDASSYYLDALGVLNSGRCTLVDDAKLRRQFLALRREHHSGGRTSVDHPAKGHDDLSNVTAMGMVEALGLDPKDKPHRFLVRIGGDSMGMHRIGGPERPALTSREERQREQNRAMVAIIARTKQRLEREDRRDWLREKVMANQPMIEGSVVLGASATPELRARLLGGVRGTT